MMTYTPLTRTQRAIAAIYCDGDMSHIESMEELEGCGDGLFTFLLNEVQGAPNKEEVQRLLQAAVEQIQGVMEGLEEEPQIPLADRYAEKVIRDHVLVVGIELEGVKYTEDRLDVIVDNENPDFYSVYARLKAGQAAAVGDFIAYEAALEYAEHLLAEWKVKGPILDRAKPKAVNP